MSLWRSIARSRIAAVAALLGLLVPLVPAAAVAHDDHHLEASILVHDEASHPDAPLHLDKEEHLPADGCLACLPTAKSVGASPDIAPHLSEPTELAVLPTRAPQLDAVRSSGPPRAPPA